MNNKELVDRTMAAIKQGITEGSRDARRRIAELESENARLRAALEEREEVLRDCWNQFAIERLDGTTWAGGLSTPEEVERVLALSPQPDGDRTAHERITSVYTERDELKAQLAEAQRERELAESHLEARESLLSELEWGNRQKKAEADTVRLRAALEAVLTEVKYEMVQWTKETRLKLIAAQPALSPRGEENEGK